MKRKDRLVAYIATLDNSQLITYRAEIEHFDDYQRSDIWLAICKAYRQRDIRRVSGVCTFIQY